MINDVPLRDYFEARIVALEKATKLAADTLEKRLEGMNEFRAQLDKQAAKFITSEALEPLRVDIRALRDDAMEAKGRSGIATYLAIVAIGISIIEAVILILK